MSHSVTIRTQTVTTSSTAIVLNISYFRTWNGILQTLQVLLGIICVAIVGHKFDDYNYRYSGTIFFMLMVTTFLIGTFILLLSCLMSITTTAFLPKTIHGLLYHAIAFGLLLAGALTLLVQVDKNKYSREYELLMGASICGLINAFLYLLSMIISLRTYRGM